MRRFDFSLITIFYSIKIWYKHSKNNLCKKKNARNLVACVGHYLKFWLNHQLTLAQHVIIAVAKESVLRQENLNK